MVGCEEPSRINGLRIAARVAALLLATSAFAGPMATPTVSPSPTEGGSPTKLIGLPTFTPPPGNLLSISPALYDIEGKEGVPSLGSPSLSGKYFEYQFKGEPPVRLPGQTGSFEYIEKPSGTPFLYRVHADQFGTIVGFGRLSGHPYVVIPVKGSEVGIHMRSEIWDPTASEEMEIGADSFIADSISHPSVVLDFVPGTNARGYAFVVEYLAGNALEDLDYQEHRFPAGSIGAGHIPGILWTSQVFSSPSSHTFGDKSPVGPLRLTLGADGLTSDTVSFVGSDNMYFEWHPLLTPATGPSVAAMVGLASLSAEEGDFIREAGVREDLLGESRCVTNLLGASDVNGDGCLDAADYQTVISRMAAEAR